MALRKLNVQLGLNTQGFSSGLKSAGKDLKDFNKDIKSADKGAASLSSGLGKLTKSAAKIAAATITIKALTKATKAAFNAYLVFEGSMIRSHDVFRDSNKYIKYFAENTAKAFGMSESAAYQYAAIYGNLFKAVTKDTEENAKVTIAMLKASAVIASKTGRTTEDVMERLRSGILGNTEAIEDLGIYAQVGMIKTSEAFKKVANGKSWEQLTFQQQQQIRILSYLEQAHSQFGDTVANTSAFSLQTLAGAFKNLTSYAGAFVNAGLQPIIRGLTQLVTWATAGVKALASLFGLELKLANTSTGATQAATAAQDDLTEAIDRTAKAKRGLASFDKLNQISSSQPAATGGGGVSAGAGGGVFDGIEVPEYADEKVSKLSKGIEKFAGVVDVLKRALKALQSAIVSSTPAFKWVWDEFLVPVGKWVGDLFISTIKAITSALERFSSWASQNKAAVETMGKVVLSFLAGMWVYNTTQNLVRFIISLTAQLKALASGLSVAGVAASMTNVAMSALAGGIILLAMNWSKMNGIERTIGILGGIAVAAASAAVAVGALQSAWSLGIAAAAIVAGTAAISYSVYSATKRANALKSELHAGQSGTIHGGKAAKFAEGGVVTSPTYALIGEDGGEVVMPLERNTGWIDRLAGKLNAQGGGGDIYLTENIYLDTGELVDTFTKRINRNSRKNNKPILAV